MTSSKHSSRQPDDGSDTLERRLDIVVTQGTPSPGGSFLLVVAGENAGKLYPLSKPELLIGRSPNADIRINEKAVSHNHARLQLDNGSCTLRDLGSTNGTFLNNELIAGSVRLRGGDAVGVGSTTFTYLAGSDTSSDQTIQLRNPSQHPPPGNGFIDQVRVQPSMPPANYAQVQSSPMARHPEDESVSLTDVLRKVQAYWVYTKRYGWLVLTCTCFGIGAGILQTRMNPPPGSAWFEMTLISESRSNPMNRESDGVQFFASAESAFRSLPLIKKTMQELGVPNLSDKAATIIQSELQFERQGNYQSQLWRGEYRDVDATRAAQFLKKHLDVYLETEIDKTLKVIRTSTEFLTTQVTESRKELKAAESKLLQFRDEHPEAIPKDAVLPNPLKETIAQATSVSGQLAQVNLEIANVKSQLARGTSLARGQLEKSKRFEDQVLVARGKIAEAKARGLTDQHPEVVRLKEEASSLERLARETAQSEASEMERQVDVETLALKEKLTKLQADQARLQTALGQANKKVEDARIESLPELQARYQDLSRDYEAKKKKHDTLAADLEAKKMSLELERASGKAHYDIITPPTPEAPSVTAAMLKRAGLGGAVGLIFAVCAAAILELRQRILARRRW
jgi:pSer/pThr/pTyr-binding forkhead associated (FHA) protein